MTLTKGHQPDIKNNWWRLVLYLFLVFIGGGIFYIPIFLFHPELFSGSRNEYNAIFEDPLMEIASLFAMSAGALLATYFMSTKIEYKTLRSIRVTANLKELIYGGAFALIAFSLFAVIAQSLQIVHITFQGFSISLFYSGVLYFLVALNEELVFRGYVLHNLLEKMNPTWRFCSHLSFLD